LDTAPAHAIPPTSASGREPAANGQAPRSILARHRGRAPGLRPADTADQAKATAVDLGTRHEFHGIQPVLPVVVDEINDSVGNAYSGMPDRL